MPIPVYLPIESEGYLPMGSVHVLESKPSRWGFQVERLIIQEASCWVIRSLIIGGEELMGSDDAMPATAFVGDMPLFVGVECPKGGTVRLEAENAFAGCDLKLIGVCSGPRL